MHEWTRTAVLAASLMLLAGAAPAAAAHREQRRDRDGRHHSSRSHQHSRDQRGHTYRGWGDNWFHGFYDAPWYGFERGYGRDGWRGHGGGSHGRAHRRHGDRGYCRH